MDRDLEREAWDKARLSFSFSLSLLLDGILKRGAGCRVDHTFAKIEIKRPPLSIENTRSQFFERPQS